MRKHFKYFVYLIVLYGYSLSFAGSYEDFFAAIKEDHPTVVQGLLGRGFDPNTISPDGQAGLILALRAPSLKVVDVLLAHPATQVEVRTLKDESPLMLAAFKGLTSVCKTLIARDADVNKPGWAPLHYAATAGHIDTMALLLEKHAYIDAASPNGSTPLMMAAMYGSSEAVRFLLDAGADPGLKNQLGLSAIDFAQQAQKADAVDAVAAAIRAKKPKGTW
jgi:ankyrin repeat protein